MRYKSDVESVLSSLMLTCDIMNREASLVRFPAYYAELPDSMAPFGHCESRHKAIGRS